MHINSSSTARNNGSEDYKLLVRGPYRTRGRVNLFAAQATKDGETDLIIELRTQGKKASEIAKAVRMSIPTLYRRIAAIKLPTDGTSMQRGGRREKMAVALLAHLQASIERMVALAAKRKEKRVKAACCSECASHILANETIRLSLEVHKAEVVCFRQLGLFDDVRTSGRAMEILEMARAQEEPEKVVAGAADIAVTSAKV